MSTLSPADAVRKACDVFGSQSRLAAKLDIRPSFVSQWLSEDRPVPVPLAIAIERETDGQVTVEELRPDVDWAVIRGGPRRDASDGRPVA